MKDYNSTILQLSNQVAELATKVDEMTGDVVSVGKCGADINYVLYSDGRLILKGTGAMYDYVGAYETRPGQRNPVHARKRLLIPLYENLSIQECDENINRIHALQAELQKMSDKKETLRKLRAQDIIDSIVFNQEMNGLESTSEEYRNEIRNLCSETNDYTELKKLIQFTNREMLTEFTDEIFEKYVSNIVIVNRNTAEFHLKCGLKIKEAL